ncbi:MAG: Re/Si-specific NAD(P)(+) transhydrogenase subunit alpha [Flavobacteriales bacterium]|nr:Re/Si-specific NAD(P)(+) transhydrogenase subunit alpha [Flavobacteriales bacterium]
MKIGVPKETQGRETRVAVTPTIAKQLKAKGFEVVVESGAGDGSFFSDANYTDADANVGSKADAYQCDVVAKVNPPTVDEAKQLKAGSTLISLLFAATNPDVVKALEAQGVNAYSLDAIPRTSLAQSMDVLSSQANLAGYKAVLLGGGEMGKIFPMLMTSAGTIKPSTVVIFGAGVAGLQAIATAKRLGANVWVSDIRPETKEQVQSLGGKFIEVAGDDSVNMAGGYVTNVSEEFLKKQQEVVTAKVAEADLVITTALIPGKKAPLLITDEMLRKMKPGAVIVDMAVSQGGNVSASKLNETVRVGGVTIIGEGNLPATLPMNASELFAKNVSNFLLHLTTDNQFNWNMEDEITAGSLIIRDGKPVHPSVQPKETTNA